MVLPTSDVAGGDWDYPSIGVDASGRIIVGAVKIDFTSTVVGFWVRVSTDGGNTWTGPSLGTRVGTSPGWHSRAVATNNKFETFIQQNDLSFNPVGVDRWESSDGITWTYMGNLATYSPPANQSPGKYSNSCPSPNTSCNCSSGSVCNKLAITCAQISYATSIDAQGYTNGNWSVAFPMRNGNYNNIFICTSDRGCGFVNAAADDQFFHSTSVSGSNGNPAGSASYWVSYLTFSTLVTRQLPLIAQSIYFHPGQAAIGATINPNIDPKSWDRVCPGDPLCGPGYCFAMGDYAGMASNPSAGAVAPVVIPSGSGTALQQNFIVDPPQDSNIPNFKPNFIPFPIGSNLSSLGRALPLESSNRPPIWNGVPLTAVFT